MKKWRTVLSFFVLGVAIALGVCFPYIVAAMQDRQYAAYEETLEYEILYSTGDRSILEAISLPHTAANAVELEAGQKYTRAEAMDVLHEEMSILYELGLLMFDPWLYDIDDPIPFFAVSVEEPWNNQVIWIAYMEDNVTGFSTNVCLDEGTGKIILFDGPISYIGIDEIAAILAYYWGVDLTAVHTDGYFDSVHYGNIELSSGGQTQVTSLVVDYSQSHVLLTITDAQLIQADGAAPEPADETETDSMIIDQSE